MLNLEYYYLVVNYERFVGKLEDEVLDFDLNSELCTINFLESQQAHMLK